MTSPYHEPARELGAFVRRHDSPPPVRNVMTLVVVFVVPAVLLFSGYQSESGQVFAGNRSTNSAIGAVLMAIGVFGIVMISRKSALKIDVYENGIVWRERGRAQKILDRDIRAIKGRHAEHTVAGAGVARTNIYEIELEDGRSYLFSNMLAHPRELATRIETGIAEHLLPRVRQAFQAEESFSFGPLKLWIDRVEHKERSLFWDDVASATIQDGVVTITAKNKDKIDVDWSALPNANTLLVIVKERAKLG